MITLAKKIVTMSRTFGARLVLRVTVAKFIDLLIPSQAPSKTDHLKPERCTLSLLVCANNWKDASSKLDTLIDAFISCDPSWELCICDTDEYDSATINVIKRRLHDPRIKWIRTSADTHTKQAFTETIQHATGEYVAFIDGACDALAEIPHRLMEAATSAGNTTVIGDKDLEPWATACVAMRKSFVLPLLTKSEVPLDFPPATMREIATELR